MRKLLTLSLLLAALAIGNEVKAANYYVSSSTGNDSYTSAQAQNPATPWQTLSKVNSFFASLQPGDQVLFMRGDIFYGSLTISRSGSSGSPITLGAYGSGPKPVITGFQDITGWTSIGGNKYEKVITGGPSMINMVTLNGAKQVLGRYPKANAANAGWLMLQSHSGSTSFTSNAISGAPSFAGGEVVIQKNRWIRDRGRVNSQSSNTVTLSPFAYPIDPTFINSIIDDRGFYFQNHPNALTQHGEWSYTVSNQKLTMYLNSAPTSYTIKGSFVDNLVTLSNRNYINFDNLEFTGSNKKAFVISSCSYITIGNCDINFHGEDAIHNTTGSTHHITITNCTANYINNMFLQAAGSNNWTVRNSSIDHVGDTKGMSLSGDGQANGISYISDGSIIENNRIKNIGYIAIHYLGNDILIQKNFIDSVLLTKDDGGGIYTSFPDAGSGGGTNRRILNNIVMHALGEKEGGGPDATWSQACGIYVDAGGENVEIKYNTVAYCGGSGLHFNGASNVDVRYNTAYSNPYAQLAWNGHSGGPSRNNIFRKNILFAKTYASYVGEIYSTYNDLNQWGSIDSNYWCRPSGEPSGVNSTGYSCVPCGAPYHDGGIIESAIPNYRYYSFDTWRTLSGWDANGKKTPFAVADADIRFEYNATNSPVVVSLGANYMTVDNVTYSGTITLQPYASAILLRTSGTPPNVPPVANAGANKTITLPTSTVTLNGSGTDVDGTIAAYQWTKISGPTGLTFGTATQATTTVNNLVQGVYQIELRVTDNGGAIGRDTVQVTVNPGNQAPVANAGTNKSITLPTSSVTLNGSGSDADGTIAAYLWTKISGPTGLTFGTATQATTTVNNLVQGVYQIELRVTDNGGAIGRDTVQVTVNPGNQAPIANAGIDQTKTLPTNSATLTGSGSDADGSISSYNWTKVSGPSSGTITTPSAATTTVTGMVQGTYKFELRVTDNGGATGRDTMQVIVNPAGNISPISNAGPDQVKTLPTNTASLAGTGSDPDGTVASYLWRKLTGSPTGGAIANTALPNTTVSNLIQGTYKYELRVTDNLGAFKRDTMQIVVNPATSNTPPVANAGPDQSLTLPANSITLSGSGTDPGGSIASYAWSKIGGPASGTITNPNAASTTVTGLTAGIYSYQLTVVDNLGLSGTDVITVFISTSPGYSGTPYLGTPHLIPGTIQAEDFDIGGQNIGRFDNTSANDGGYYRQDGVDIEVAGEGGHNVAYTEASEWAKYTVNVTSAGTYTLQVRLSSPYAGKSLRVEMDGTTIATIDVPDTDGWQFWQTISVTNISLSTGIKVMRIFNVTDGFNLNYVTFTYTGGPPPPPPPTYTGTPYGGTPHPIPGTIQSEAFDNGGQNVARFDNTSANDGGHYRADGVDIEACSEGGYNIAYTEASEWAKYTVNVMSTGTYTLQLRVSCPYAAKSLRVEMDGVTIATINVPDTDGWQNWQTVSVPNISLSAGIKVMRVFNVTDGFNINYVSFTQTGGSSRPGDTEVVEQPGSGLEVYPNPATSTIQLRIVPPAGAATEKVNLRIYDAGGVMVHRDQFQSQQMISRQINIGHLKTGTYIVEIMFGEKKRQTIRFIKL